MLHYYSDSKSLSDVLRALRETPSVLYFLLPGLAPFDVFRFHIHDLPATTSSNGVVKKGEFRISI